MNVVRGSGTMSSIRLVAEGREQNIIVDYKTMLIKVMAALGEISPPAFCEIDCGIEGVKVSINLRLNLDNQIKMAVVEGKPFISNEDAEKSAITKAFRYIEQHWKVKVLDFSSRLAMSINVFNRKTNVKEVMDCVIHSFNEFQTSLRKCKDVGNEIGGLAVKAPFCIAVINFVRNLAEQYSVRATLLSSKIRSLESQNMKYHESTNVTRGGLESQCFFKKVVLPSKVLLDYVLLYLGLEKAKYTNGPDDAGMVEGVVKFRFPYMKNIKYGGKLKITGTASNSANAEENAAFKALLFIEDNFKVTVVDLNFSDRVNAEKEDMMSRRFLRQIVEVGNSVKELLNNYISDLRLRNDQILSEKVSLFDGSYGQEEIDSCQIILAAVARLGEDSVKSIGACWELFARMDEISWNLNHEKLNA